MRKLQALPPGMANWNQPFSQPVLSIPLVGGTGCFFSGINEMPPK
jgi:hypothetical protein